LVIELAIMVVIALLLGGSKTFLKKSSSRHK